MNPTVVKQGMGAWTGDRPRKTPGPGNASRLEVVPQTTRSSARSLAWPKHRSGGSCGARPYPEEGSLCEGLNSRSALHTLTRVTPQPALRSGTAPRFKPESLSVRIRPWAPTGESAKWPSGWPFKPDNLAGSSPVSPAITHLELRAAEASALTRVGAGSSPARCTKSACGAAVAHQFRELGHAGSNPAALTNEGIVQWQYLSLPS